MVFESLHELAPDYLTSKFSERNTSYNLRDFENKLNDAQIHSNIVFSYSTLWNGLS